MIKANELRIGNRVLLNGQEIEISMNSFRRFLDFDSEEDYNGIHLTPEILVERCGFEKSNHHSLDYFLKRNNSNLFSFRLNRPFRHNNQWYPVKEYLHQLQNLVLDLTGQELQIKELQHA